MLKVEPCVNFLGCFLLSKVENVKKPTVKMVLIYKVSNRPGGAMVAQQTSNLKVVGSSPTPVAFF